MKNKKFKLFASLTSLVMVVAVMAVGVWAATQASVGITSSVSFTASDYVRATVAVTDVTVTNATKGAVDLSGATATINGGAESGSFTVPNVALTQTGENSGKDITITYTITITNLATAGSAFSTLNASVADNSSTLGTPSIGDSVEIAQGADPEEITVSYTINPSITLTSTNNGVALTVTLTTA